MVNKIKIGKKFIGEGEKTFIIAEIGINHNGSLETAKKLIIKAKEAGADAVKFQTYITEKRVKKESPIYNVLKQCELSNEQTKELFNFCQKNNIIFFSTPFDEESVDFLIEIGVKLLKIASFDITNYSLLRKAAKAGVIIIFSIGMASKEEIDSAIKIFDENNVTYCILHCISSYPTQKKDSNLNVISHLKRLYNCPVGYSDHTIGFEIPILSVAAGASIIEKHFTLNNSAMGPDHKLSANPQTMKKMIKGIRKIEIIMGSNILKTRECEKPILQYRRKSM